MLPAYFQVKVLGLDTWPVFFNSRRAATSSQMVIGSFTVVRSELTVPPIITLGHFLGSIVTNGDRIACK